MDRPLNLVGPNVRRLRNSRGLSQAKLATQCQLLGWDITREGIAKIEGRVRHVDDFEMAHLCRVFGVKAEVLLAKTPRHSPGP
jgi:transcriptional regulator with XRE-family HTH domain